jgi:hypothetical protein
MAHEEPEQHQEDQRSGHDCQGSSPRRESISSGLQKEFPFPLSSKMGTFRTANEKGHSASPRLCACLTLLREQGVRNGFGFILVQAVESLQTGWPESARALCQAQLIISLPIRARFPRAWYGSTFHEPSRDRPRRFREWRGGAFDGYSPRSVDRLRTAKSRVLTQVSSRHASMSVSLTRSIVQRQYPSEERSNGCLR